MARGGMLGRFLGRLFPSRPTPVRTTTQARHVVDRLYGGKTKDLARELGVSQRSVERYIKGTRTPRGKEAERLEQLAAQAQTSERSRERKERQLAQAGGADSGVSASVRLSGTDIGGSDVLRYGERTVTVNLTGEQAARVLANPSDDEVSGAVGEALGSYFQRPGYSFTFEPGTVDFH